MQTSGTKFTLFTVATMMCVVACTNNNGKLGVTPKGDQKPIQNACVDSLKASEQTKIGGKLSVSVCQFPIGGTSTIPVATNHPVSYWIQGGGTTAKLAPTSTSSANTVHLKMLVGFEETKSTIDKTKRQKFADVIGEDCGVSIAKIFERSTDNGMHLALNLNYIVVDSSSNNDGISDPDADAPDDILSITQQTIGGDLSWQIDQLPTRPHFYGKAKVADENSCEGDPVTKKACVTAKRKSANVPFCAALAKRIGNTLGIVNAESEKAMCGAVQPEPVTVVSTPTPTATPVAAATASEAMIEDASYEITEAGDLVAAVKPNPSSDSSFAKPTGKDDEWLSKATLNHKDVVTIMSPVCKDMK